MARIHKTQYYPLVSIFGGDNASICVYSLCAYIAVPLPQFEGLDSEAAASPHVGVTAAAAHGPAMTITPEEREKYYSIFRVHQPAGGFLDGESAKNIFMKSKLPTEALGQIW